MLTINNRIFGGERPLYGLHDADLKFVTFINGESPLKETNNLSLDKVTFQYKYPLWNANNIKVTDSIFEEMSRSGIWYTNNIEITNSEFQSPKMFRRSNNIKLDNVHFSDAEEAFWECSHIEINNVSAAGNYLFKNSSDIQVDHLNLIGNYAFDGAKNVTITNSKLVSKDCFWNSENVLVKNCIIDGEYLAWHARNIKFENCYIQSDQGLNYVDQLTIRHSNFINSKLLFEYCHDLDAEINGDLTSIKNPYSGKISCDKIELAIIDPNRIDPTKVKLLAKVIKKLDNDPNPNE
ncbi:MAG: DUF3737 family protein [Lactobacillus sp.]|nr:DUF3737 family protein [Lactobacillus sp.]